MSKRTRTTVFLDITKKRGFLIVGVDQDGKDQLYQWKFIPFGLKNAHVRFQKVMDQIISGLPFARCHIDNVIIFSKTPQEHVKHIQAVLTIMAVEIAVAPWRVQVFS